MKIIRYLSLASLLIPGFATAMQADVYPEIEVSNQAANAAIVWSRFYNDATRDMNYFQRKLSPYTDMKFLAPSPSTPTLVYTSKGEYKISVDYNNHGRLQHLALPGNEQSLKEEILQEELIKSGKKLVAIVKPDGTVSLTSR